MPAEILHPCGVQDDSKKSCLCESSASRLIAEHSLEEAILKFEIATSPVLSEA
jgi:hypothetical protein